MIAASSWPASSWSATSVGGDAQIHLAPLICGRQIVAHEWLEKVGADVELAPTRSRLPCRASSARACMSSKAVACGMKASARVVAGSRYDCAAPALRRPALRFCKCCDTVGWPAPTPSPRSENCLFERSLPGSSARPIQHAAGSALGRRFAALIGRAPANTWMMFCAAQRSISRRTARTADPMCGVNSVFGCASSAGSISRGRSARAQSSISNTSAAYPPSWLAKRREHGGFIHYRTTTGFTSRAPGRTRASSSALTRCWVSASRKRQQDEVRAGEEFAARHLAQAEPLLGLCIQSLRPWYCRVAPHPLQAISHGQSGWRPCQGCRP